MALAMAFPMAFAMSLKKYRCQLWHDCSLGYLHYEGGEINNWKDQKIKRSKDQITEDDDPLGSGENKISWLYEALKEGGSFWQWSHDRLYCNIYFIGITWTNLISCLVCTGRKQNYYQLFRFGSLSLSLSPWLSLTSVSAVGFILWPTFSIVAPWVVFNNSIFISIKFWGCSLVAQSFSATTSVPTLPPG